MEQYPEVSPFFSKNNVNQMQVESEAVQQEKQFDENGSELHYESSNESDQQFDNEATNNPPGKVKRILTDVLTTENNFMKLLIKKQLHHLENSLELQRLFEQQEIEKNDSLELQMSNEKLSFERENVISSSEVLISKVKNVWKVCNNLLNHYKLLIYFKEEEINPLKKNFVVEMEKCSRDIKNLSRFSNSIIEDYRKKIVCLKAEAQEESQRRIAEVADANSTFEINNAISEEEMSLYKAEDDRNSSLMLEDQELTKKKEEEALKFKEELENANDSSYSYASKNMLLESEISSNKSKEFGLEETLQSLLNQGEAFQNQSTVLEDDLNTISTEIKDLKEELNTVKEKVSTLEVNVDEKRTKQETSEQKKKEIIEQNLNCENELLVINREMEDIKNKEIVASKEVEELNLTLETNQSEYESVNNENEANLCEVQNVLADILTKLNVKVAETNEHAKKKDDILNKFEESDREMKSLETEIEIVKSAVSEELTEMNSLNTFIEGEKSIAEQLSQTLILRQKEVETTENDLERTLKESAAYKEEVLATITRMKQEVFDVKEKQKITGSECNEKQQDIMKYLDESRNDSMEKSNQIEAEIDSEKKENENLKEKLNGIYNEKVSIERDLSLQINILENKIKQLNDELDSVIIKSAEWRETQVIPDQPTAIQSSSQNQIYMEPPPVKKSQPNFRKRFVESDSDQSSIDFNDYIKTIRTKIPGAAYDSPKKRKISFYPSSQPVTKEKRMGMQDNYHKKDLYGTSKKRKPTQRKRTMESEPLDLLSTL